MSSFRCSAPDDEPLDSLAQFCGLSLPTFNREVGSCSLALLSPQSAHHDVQALPACPDTSRCRNALTSSPEIVAYPCRRSSRGSAPWPQTASLFRPDLAPRAPRVAGARACPAHRQPVRGSRGAGRTVCRRQHRQALCPDRPTGRSRDTDEGRQGSDRRLPPARTTPTRITPGPANAPSQARYAPSPARLDNRNRMSVAKPSRRPTDSASVRISDRARSRSRQASSRHPSSRREPMTARAGPSA